MVRHKSGRYYVRAFGNGKEIWRRLRTSNFSVAKAKLAEFLKEHRKKEATSAGEASAQMRFAESLAIHQRNQADDVSIKPATRHYWNQIFVALLKSWQSRSGTGGLLTSIVSRNVNGMNNTASLQSGKAPGKSAQ